MGTQLQSAKTKFSSLLTEIKPVVAQFVVWLDEKVAEYKVYGYMNLDSGNEAPKWIKDYSLSILVSGMSEPMLGEKSNTPQSHPVVSKRAHPSRHGPHPHNIHKKTRSMSNTVVIETRTTGLAAARDDSDDDVEIISVKQERLGEDEYADCAESDPEAGTGFSGLDDSTFNIAVESFDDNITGVDVKQYKYELNPLDADSNNADSNGGENSFLEATDGGASTSFQGPFDTSAASSSVLNPTTDPQAQGYASNPVVQYIGGVPCYVCSFCGRPFRERSTLRRHEHSVHIGYRPFKCRFCEKSFVQPSDKHRHENTHLGIRPHKCQFCEKRFTQSGTRLCHERSIHRSEGVKFRH